MCKDANQVLNTGDHDRALRSGVGVLSGGAWTRDVACTDKEYAPNTLPACWARIYK